MQNKSAKIQRAMAIAKKLHSNQLRRSGESLYDHINRVAKLLEDSGITSEDIICAAYLHHALANPQISVDYIRDNFGEDVCQIVFGYVQVSEGEFKELEPSIQNEKLIVQTYLNLVKDSRVLLLRIIDKTDNATTIYALNQEERSKVSKKALYFYAPLARLVHLNNSARTLENEAFKNLYPDKYYAIESKLTLLRPSIEKFFEDSLDAMEELLKENELDVDISMRIKHEYGIFRKLLYLESIGHTSNISELGLPLDAVGVRIITRTTADCYLVNKILTQLWTQWQDTFDDFIEKPRKSGYQGLHNIFISRHFPFEVQIRTKDMHEYSEFGPASHAIYKIADKDKSNKKALRYINAMLQDNPDWIRDLEYKSLAENINKQLNPFKDQIYVFTPKGDIVELPVGSNVIDFAYAVHTDLGNSCVGASINGEYCKLTQEIKTGDLVKVKTDSKRTKPKLDWLDVVKTYRARKEIRKAYNLLQS